MQQCYQFQRTSQPENNSVYSGHDIQQQVSRQQSRLELLDSMEMIATGQFGIEGSTFTDVSPGKVSVARDNNIVAVMEDAMKFPRSISWNRRVIICATASAAGSSNQDSELNPYEVLGVSPIDGFDVVKASYTKKRKEAERNNDEAMLPV
ncbi:hypothetical protein LWI28_016582 [Acer negundo]|uniref:Uncharacterized protein n=1 Tax=Acer negundo TaxID=4023 RepID=A0AAD5J6H6_ACENE|nr:hypothetical protein LWI28_016582 [Acer negundo]